MTETAIRPPFIVAVDDEPNILNALRRCLRPTGAEFEAFDSPVAALSALASREPALIISDMRMPGMDGAEFLSKARAVHPAALRILLTGYSDYDKAMSAVNDGGIWRHLSKPWNDQELIACVNQALQMRSLAAEKTRLEEITRAQRDELKLLNRSLETKVLERTRELSEANTKLSGNFSTLVKVLSGIVDARFSGGRIRRVAEIARRAAIQLNLQTADCDRIYRAALLHPIGRISLPDSLLSTPRDKLSAEQLKLWRAYPVNGDEMLMALEDLKPESAIIRSHCERFDGQGFPDRRSGEAISIGARVLAAAIAFDEILDSRSLDDPQAAGDAARELMKQTGRRLCPKSCDAILAAFCIKAAPEKASPKPQESQIECRWLKPGMALSRDALAPSGTLLLAAGQQLTASIIDQLQRFEERHETSLRFWISMPAQGENK